ncbi:MULTISPECIES: KilA-N domain-containing protein [unclassified Gilliamella]|uniref:KilA-N domain-containing protein n=1 Tax=unclassified Gilliamella TaxID=2685620 RepID=UPI00226A7DB3|nr:MULTISPECIES: KilA-N domain-containing protein [unclassified Gilliamella]MCX8583446.1 KilA-N domain-containing protein [Gilliamella sp. B3372]MCX8594058.1 KilA-N domain-containing protein [Gilliamella sp. B3367]
MTNINTNNLNCPVIAGVSITTDKEGRYNLNALHKASGGKDAKRPKAWLATKSTQELIEELRQNSAFGQEIITVTKGGTHQGTFAHELLAVSYAGWISPKFQLMANQVFLDYKKGELKNIQKPFKSYLPEYRQAKAMELSVRALDKMFSNLPHLSEQSKQAIYADTINPIAGKNVIPLPKLENKTFSASEVGHLLDVSSNKIGRIANKLNLKTDEYGIFVLDKSRSSDKQVETFRYNEKAIDVIKTHLINKEIA